MGYTHYFSIDTKSISQKEWKDLCKKINMLVYVYAQEHGGIAGFSAHAKPGRYDGVLFNGSRENGHEDFSLRAEVKDQDQFNFCKTARKPYDLLVVGALVLMQDILKEKVNIRSDGSYPDWVAGTEYVSKVMGRKMAVPSGIVRTSKRHHFKVVA